MARSNLGYYLAATMLLGCASAPPAAGQVVQLPTFRVFSVATTVVVPDRGQVTLGGVGRRRATHASAGLPGVSGLPWVNRLGVNRSLAVETSASSAAVTVTIHDLAALDKAVLAEARGGRDASASPATDWRLSGHTSDPVGPRETRGVAEIRVAHARADQQRQAELHEEFARGEAAEAAGRQGAARCIYQRVARLSSGSLAAAAQARLAALAEPNGKRVPAR